jgi:hypothetical protein
MNCELYSKFSFCVLADPILVCTDIAMLYCSCVLKEQCFVCFILLNRSFWIWFNCMNFQSRMGGSCICQPLQVLFLVDASVRVLHAFIQCYEINSGPCSHCFLQFCVFLSDTILVWLESSYNVIILNFIISHILLIHTIF